MLSGPLGSKSCSTVTQKKGSEGFLDIVNCKAVAVENVSRSITKMREVVWITTLAEPILNIKSVLLFSFQSTLMLNISGNICHLDSKLVNEQVDLLN